MALLQLTASYWIAMSLPVARSNTWSSHARHMVTPRQPPYPLLSLGRVHGLLEKIRFGPADVSDDVGTFGLRQGDEPAQQAVVAFADLLVDVHGEIMGRELAGWWRSTPKQPDG
jgi:hypothetical protein